jgi:hypothetical protein
MSYMQVSSTVVGAASPQYLQDIRTSTSSPRDVINSDPLLFPFLRACDEEGAQIQLTRLLAEHVQPLIKNIVGYKLGVFLNRPAYSYRQQEAEDLYEDVLLQIIARLRHLKAYPYLPILVLQGYVAVVTYRACRKYMARLNAPPFLDSFGVESETSDTQDAGHVISSRLTIAGPTNFTAALENHNYLQYTWKEICLLPVGQRTAILLNLKDSHGTNLIALLPAAG